MYEELDAIDVALLLEIWGISREGVCGRGSTRPGSRIGNSMVGSIDRGLMGLDDLRILASSGEEDKLESKLREFLWLADANEAPLFRRLGTSTLLIWITLARRPRLELRSHT